MGVAPPEVCCLIGAFHGPPFAVRQVLVVQVEAVRAIFPFIPYMIVAAIAVVVPAVVIVMFVVRVVLSRQPLLVRASRCLAGVPREFVNAACYFSPRSPSVHAAGRCGAAPWRQASNALATPAADPSPTAPRQLTARGHFQGFWGHAGGLPIHYRRIGSTKDLIGPCRALQNDNQVKNANNTRGCSGNCASAGPR